MIVVTGLGVSSLILSRIGWPQPGFFVSTTVTPLADEHGRVAAAALQHEEVVLELLDFDDLRRGCRRLRLLKGRHRQRQRPGREERHRDTMLVSCDPSRKEHALNEPECAGGDDDDRADERELASGRSRCATRSAASADATATTTSSCPISTPTLNENSDQPSARRGRSISRSTFANPNPWMKPNANAIQARTSRPPRTIRLSAPT